MSGEKTSPELLKEIILKQVQIISLENVDFLEIAKNLTNLTHRSRNPITEPMLLYTKIGLISESSSLWLTSPKMDAKIVPKPFSL